MALSTPLVSGLLRRHRCRRRAAVAALVVLAGCAAQREHSDGLDLLAKGRPVEGVESLRRANALEPDNVRYRIDYLDQRASAALALIRAADDDRTAGRLDAAQQHYREAERIDPASDRVQAGLAAVDAERRAIGQLQAADRQVQAKQFEQALETVRRVLKEIPQQQRAAEMQRSIEQRLESDRVAREEQLAAHAAFRKPVTLQFRDTPLKVVFDALSRLGNVNVIVDREVKSDLKTTIYARDAAIEDTLDVILLQNQLEKRVLNGNTLMIYPATSAKQKELAELKVRSFQLSNIDVALMANIIKTMIKTKDIVTDARANLLVMRDTPEAIALAERLIAANDLPDPEVMLEVQVLEVSSSRTSEIGLKLPTSFTVSTPSTGADGSLSLGGLLGLKRNDLQVSGLSATLNMLLQDGDTNILASPRIRSRNKEKARILVGDKLPIITNLISPQQAGQNSVITGSIQYVDVGIKLEIEPQVYSDDDVGIKLNLEVSNVSDTIQTDSGRAYQIGTRSAQTTLRLHDGETQVMAGLINDTDRSSAQKVPGIGQLPVLGHLFSNHTGDRKKSEIVLSITPHIIRAQAVPDMRAADAWSGSESTVRDRPLRIEPLAVVKASPAGSAEPAAPTGRTARPASSVATPSAASSANASAPATDAGAAAAAPAPQVRPDAATDATVPMVQTHVMARPVPGRASPVVPPAAPAEGPAAAASSAP